MSEFMSGVLAGAFGMFGFLMVAAFAFGAAKVAGDADEESERIRARLIEHPDPERVL